MEVVALELVLLSVLLLLVLLLLVVEKSRSSAKASVRQCPSMRVRELCRRLPGQRRG